MKFKKLFTELLAEPSEPESKWVVVGFFCAIMLLGSLLLPVMVLIAFFKPNMGLSVEWFTIITSLIAWVVAYRFTYKYWFRFSMNFGWLMYLSDKKDRERRTKKQSFSGKQTGASQ